MSENVVYLLNGLGSCMLPCGGIIRLNPMNIDEAKSMVQNKKVVSYVERQDTAQALSTLLGINVPINSGQLIANDISMGILLHINGQVDENQLNKPDELLKLIDKGVIKLYRVLIDPYPC
ncbi:STIV orfB116 family protein [Caldivirga sp.]|uniref:STIV orfB116 family protein n=1 Tax=Caldivirga sp. TaxID=2080243 RepID=UPI0025C6366C|nr:DUF1874 domain-containing protein [Caldivirga sp.]